MHRICVQCGQLGRQPNASSCLLKALGLNRENSPITYWIWTDYNISGMLKRVISSLLNKRQNKKPGEYSKEKSEQVNVVTCLTPVHFRPVLLIILQIYPSFDPKPSQTNTPCAFRHKLPPSSVVALPLQKEYQLQLPKFSYLQVIFTKYIKKNIGWGGGVTSSSIQYSQTAACEYFSHDHPF